MGEKITFMDVFKNSFTENFGQLSISTIVLSLGITFVLGLFIFYIYKKTYNGVLYTKSFNVSLLLISLVTCVVILAISSNVVLSLGMVGALSIVRFRTAVKDSMDLVYMFWAIAVGIVNGAGLFLLGIIGSGIIAVILIAMNKFDYNDNAYLLIMNYDDSADENKLLESIKAEAKKCKIKSKSFNKNQGELTLELRLIKENASFVNNITKERGVSNAMLVSYNGDYTS
ncbi:DUF4956 domain-containing protein [Oceanirhabdus sp. W0125-5]|uniref:DUF4956 domain-containing protein n=1 Tax=Oceanirhabdus sp. W0125-5 TaxID=2999116 RepID=UPI0022F32D52|nr:DUF4956 domain-containing protein [Oceanirhabdus sp. W0125-5]WBW99075.1 DUF4956 domain-containing protein [Oceanirhabdus sp. W0125-5]